MLSMKAFTIKRKFMSPLSAVQVMGRDQYEDIVKKVFNLLKKTSSLLYYIFE